MKIENKKIVPSKIIRRLIQIISFIFMPSLFIFCFSSIKDIYVALINGNFSIGLLSYQILTLAAVMPVTILMGRFFCGFLCAFGTMSDFIWFIGRKISKNKLKISEKTDHILKLFKYVVLLLIVIVFWTLGFTAFNMIVDPWTIFGMYASFTGWASASYLVTIGAVLLLMIILGSFFVERFFCRYLCPLGAVFAMISRARLFKIKKPSKDCLNCRVCTRQCSMAIPLYKYDQVKSGECINCFECINSCPKKNVSANPAPSVAAAVTVAAIAGLYYAGNLANNQAETRSYTATAISSGGEERGKYTDGIYTGTASGYKGETSVSVSVKSGYINSIEVLSTGDDAEFFNRAKSIIIGEIISVQNTNVDTVSGATFSSNAIKNAVKNALGSLSDTTDTAQSGATASGQTNSPVSGSASVASDLNLKDGVYSGTGMGFKGSVSVSVTVENGKISDIKVKSYSDDQSYFTRAQSIVIPEIISSQSIQVDTVSGATFSSNGIKNAVANALGIQFTNPNGTTSSPKHGGRKF